MSPVIKYFTGETAESYLFLSLGIAGLVLSLWLILAKQSKFLKGLAVPFIFVSVLEIIVGAAIIFRSPGDIIRVEHYIENEKTKIRTNEIPRMEKVMRNFVIFRYTEMALILTGMLIYFAFARYGFWKGFGLGLLIQASVVLTLDFFAERRGFVYLEYLKSISHE